MPFPECVPILWVYREHLPTVCTTTPLGANPLLSNTVVRMAIQTLANNRFLVSSTACLTLKRVWLARSIGICYFCWLLSSRLQGLTRWLALTVTSIPQPTFP